MKVFLSWAGEASKHMATTLYSWLPQVIYTLEPWMSTRIEKGDSWDGAISDALHESPVAILCLTAESLESKYLHYEAGAIANTKGSKPCTLLLGITDLDVKHPLARFQHTRFTKDDMLVLLQTINSKMKEVGEIPISDHVLTKSLDHNWPELVEANDALATVKAPSTSRNQKDMLEEILETVRVLASKERQPVTTKPSPSPSPFPTIAKGNAVYPPPNQPWSANQQFTMGMKPVILSKMISYIEENKISTNLIDLHSADIINYIRWQFPGLALDQVTLEGFIQKIKVSRN